MGLEVIAEIAASAYPDRVALGPASGGLTYPQLLARATSGAAVLQRSGGHQVAFLGLNGPSFSVALLAAALAGMPIAPLNYRLADAQLVDLLERLDQPVILADEGFERRLKAADRPTVTTEQWLSDTQTDRRTSHVDNRPDSPAVLLFTSGTTASPKAVVLRHEHLVAYVLQTVELFGASEDECALVSVPPYHVAGVAAVLTNLYAGRRVTHLPQFTAAGWLELVRQQQVTNATVVPTMLAQLVDHLDGSEAGVDSLMTLSYGGARVPPRVLTKALGAFPNTGLVNGYGLTETSSTVAILGPDDHRRSAASQDPATRARLASVGRAVPGVELSVRGPAGNPLPMNELGELWVRGPQVSGEYLGSGSGLDADGWFHTRDRARIDAEGYIFVEGRSDDTIIRGGENVAPSEIEDALLRHPHVREAAVVGVPDEEWGQRIHAVVVLDEDNPGLDGTAVREWVRPHLRSTKTPDLILVWKQLPYNQMGKLLRREVLAQVTSLLTGHVTGDGQHREETQHE